MPIRLEVDDGRDVRSVRVPRSDATVGRGRDADVRLALDGVSRRHARIRVVGDAVEVVDLESKNGVRVRGRTVPRAIVSPGESFALGTARITVVEAAAETRLTPSAEVRRAIATPPPPPSPRNPTASRPALREPHPHRDFDELLYVALRKTPWYATSVGLHMALFLLLTVVDLGLTPPPPPDDVLVVLSDASSADALDEKAEELLVDDVLESMERLVPDSTEEESELEPLPIDAPQDEEMLDAPLLLDPRTSAPFDMDARGETAIGLTATAALGANLGSSFGKDDAGQANTLAARALRSSPFTRNLLKGLRLRTSHVNVRVLGGEYDECESVLERLELEYDILLPGELDLAQPGREIRAIFSNCTSKPLTPRALDHLERFVHAGGYLFTTDWGLENVLEQRFSRYVRTLRTRGKVVMTEDEVISFDATTKHPLLRGLPTGAQKARWWLEDSSLLIDIVDPRAVEVLIESDELEARHGSRYVAVTFRHGRGRVVHVLGHFFQKEGNLRGTVAMQRILLNFLYQSLRGG
jgi:hypothetical protein